MTLTQAPRARSSKPARCEPLRKELDAVDPGAAAQILQSKLTACEAGLQYASPDRPGIRRVKVGSGFKYVDPRGKVVKDANILGRIKSLVIPPAWKDVWISPHPLGHIQAVGFDARGRKQYRYHPRWRETRDSTKYGKMLAFARALPTIRARTRRDLAKPGLSREKVLAACVRVMEKTLIRVGNDEYAKENKSYGLTTLRDQHAKIRGAKVTFRFRGKSGVFHDVDLDEPKLARIIRKCQELPGEELFQYMDDDGNVRDVGSQDVNEYLKEIAGDEFTAKDFRTWAGTVLAAQALAELRTFNSQAEAKRNIVKAVERVAAQLGNTKAVCRKCYIHPEILHAYLDGDLVATLRRRAADMAKAVGKLRAEEAFVLALLQRRLAKRKH